MVPALPAISEPIKTSCKPTVSPHDQVKPKKYQEHQDTPPPMCCFYSLQIWAGFNSMSQIHPYNAAKGGLMARDPRSGISGFIISILATFSLWCYMGAHPLHLALPKSEQSGHACPHPDFFRSFLSSIRLILNKSVPQGDPCRSCQAARPLEFPFVLLFIL